MLAALRKWSIRIALWLCVLLIGVLASAELLLNTSVARTQLRGLIQRLASDALHTHVELDQLVSISVTHARLAGLRVYDRKGRVVASVALVDLTFDPSRLIAKRVHLPTLVVDDAYVDLGAPDGKGGGLLGVLAQQPKTEAEDPADEGGGLRIELPSVKLRRARVELALPDERLAVHKLETELGLAIEPGFAADLRALRCELLRGDRALGAIERAHGALGAEGEAALELEAVIAGATLKASAKLGKERDGELPLIADVRVRELSAQTLAQLGVDGAWLTSPHAVAVQTRGTTRAFDYTLAIDGKLAELEAAGHVIAPQTEQDSLSLTLAIERGRYQDIPLPRTNARARLHERRGVSVERFEATAPSLHVTATGRVAPDGAFTLSAQAKSPALQKAAIVQRFAAGASGSLETEVELTRGAGGALGVKLDARMQRPLFASARAGRLGIVAHLQGPEPDKLQGHIGLDARDLQIGEVQTPHATITLNGSASRATAKGRFGDKGTFDLVLSRDGERFGVDGEAHLVVDRGGDTVHALVRELRYAPGPEVSVREARFAYKNARARVAGRFAPKRDSELTLTAQASDLSRVTEAFMEEPLVGELELEAKASGGLQTPDVELRVRYVNDTLIGNRRLPKRFAVETQVHVEREHDAPVVEAKLESEVEFRDDLGPIDLELEGRYAQSAIELKLEAKDGRGPLLRTGIKTGFEHTQVVRDLEGLSKLLVEREWQASLWVGARRIDQMPGVRSFDVPKALWPAQVSAKAEFKHETDKEPEGSLEAKLAWDPPGREAEDDELACGMSRRPTLSALVDMQRGKLKAKLDIAVEGNHMAAIETSMDAPVDRWFNADAERIQPANVSLRADELQLKDLPVVCEHATGFVSGTVELERAMLAEVHAEIALRAREVRFVEGAPTFDAQISGSADRQGLNVKGTIKAAHGDALLEATLPLDGSGRVPTLALDEPMRAHVDLRSLDARALLGAISAVRTTGGEFAGTIDASGSLRSPTFKGELSMHDVSVTLAEAGQRFDRVNGKIALDGRHLKLYPTRVHDRDGWVELSGDATLIDLTTYQAELTAKAKRFRVRRSGVIVALFDGTVGLTAKVDPKQQTSLDVTLDDARVELTGESLAGVQALDPHADIEFVDDLPQPDVERQVARRATPIVLRIVSKSPFWVRREDFSALVSTDIRVEVRDGHSNLSGPVDIERGYVELLGQLFDIDEGRIQFTGSGEVEPTISLIASRSVPGGSKIGIKAEGPLYDPELTFTLDGQAVTAGEALAAATGASRGTGSESTVQGEVSSMAAGIAGSVLTLGARRELGDWVPVLAIERGEHETRVRAGVEAGRFIPKFLRKIVVDAYVEGIFQAQSPDTAPTQSGTTSGVTANAGVLLELRFPKQLIGEAQYGPGQQWSLDLSWQP